MQRGTSLICVICPGKQSINIQTNECTYVEKPQKLVTRSCYLRDTANVDGNCSSITRVSWDTHTQASFLFLIKQLCFEDLEMCRKLVCLELDRANQTAAGLGMVLKTGTT